MELLQTQPVFAGAALVLAVFGLLFYLNWRRRQALETLAASMGMPFSKAGPEPYSLEATGLEIFRQGRSRKASNLMETAAPAGRLQFFDYRYVTGGGKNSSTHNFTLALITCQGNIPVFELKPETLIYKIGEAVGFKDIDLPAFPVFSDKYRLTGPDEASVHMFFTPKRAAWLERNLGLRVQGAPGHMVVYKREGHLPADSWQAFIEEVKTFSAEVVV